MHKKAYVKSIFLACTLAVHALGAAPAHAEQPRELAMLNSEHVNTMLNAVVPGQTKVLLDNLKSGELARPAAHMPMWILETIDSSILYYQGQEAFATLPARRLVDDAGFRFGQAAIDKARRSKGTWLTLSLGGTRYEAYCASKYPFVTCTLVTGK